MHLRDSIKLVNAGFQVIRRDEYALCIKYLTPNGGWAVLEKNFPSKAALNRRMKDLLKDPKVVEDL